MTTENKSIAVLEQYPSNKYNRLIPVKSIQEIPVTHKVVINEVQIDPDPDGGKDVYVQQKAYKDKKTGQYYPEKLSLTKKGLAKLMAAANIQVIESKSIEPARCQRCFTIAEKTKLAPRCFECPGVDDIAWQVIIAVPEPSGTVRIIKASKELRIEDEKARMTEKQFQQFFAYRTEHAESKALNRALREAMMIKDSYLKEELQKPFAVALVVPNLNDKDMKQAYIRKFENSQGALFGVPNSQQVAATNDASVLETGSIQEVGFTDEAKTTIEITDIPDIPEDAPNFDMPENYIDCEGQDCARIIEQTTDNNGKVWTPEELADFSQKHFGKKLCAECLKKALSQHRKESAK
jgi:hypothetical protein